MPEIGNLDSVCRCASAASAGYIMITNDQRVGDYAVYDSSSARLKDALRVSLTAWFAASIGMVGSVNKTPDSSKNKSPTNGSDQAISANVMDSTAQQITANRDLSRQAQANVGPDVALYLLSVGLLVELVPEPEPRQLTLFGTDEMGLPIKTRVPARPL